jgi:hypothetical protein
MICVVNGDFTISGYFTFQVTGGAVGVIKGNAGYVVRPLGEFLGNGADTAVVGDQCIASNSRVGSDGYAMAADATIGSQGLMGVSATVARCASGLSDAGYKSMNVSGSTVVAKLARIHECRSAIGANRGMAGSALRGGRVLRAIVAALAR